MVSTLAFFGLLVAAQFFAIVFQHAIPPLAILHGARPLLYPVLLAYGALALPQNGTLALAFFSGLLWDALTVQFLPAAAFSSGGAAARALATATTLTTTGAGAAVENPLGWSIVLYALLGMVMHGLRPWFLRGRWEVHVLASGVCAVVIPLAEYLLLTFRRGGLVFPVSLWPRLLLPGLVAMLMAPVVYLLFHFLAGLVGYPIRAEEEEE